MRVKCGTAKAASDAEEVRWVQLGDVEKYDLTETFRAFFQRSRQKLEGFDSCCPF